MFASQIALFYLQFLANGVAEDLQHTNTNFISNIIDYHRINHVSIFSSADLIKEIPSTVIVDGNFTKILHTRTSEEQQCPPIYNKDTTLTLVYFSTLGNSILETAASCLNRTRQSKIIFIQSKMQWTSKDIVDFFKWTWSKFMTNSILVTRMKNGKNQVYMYNPFPNITIENITGLTSGPLFKTGVERNFKGFRLKTWSEQNIPHFFQYTNKAGQIITSGTQGLIIAQFMKYVNCNLRYSRVKPIFLSASRTLVKGGYDISPYTERTSKPRSSVDYSYPLHLSKFCLMIPMGREIPSYMYLVLPFQKEVWIVILFSVAYITGSLHFARILKFGKSEIGASFSQVMSGIIFIGFPRSFLKEKSLRIRIIHIKIIVLGFILTSYYNTLSTSFFSETVYKRQPNTFEEMMEDGIKILQPHEKTMKQIMEYYKAPKEVEKMIVYNEYEITEKNYIHFNYSYAMLAQKESSEFRLRQQRLLKKKLFRISDICNNEIFAMFVTQKDSFLLEPLKLFIMKIREAGLIHYWDSLTYRDLVSLKRFEDMKEYEHGPKVIKLNNLIILWYLWGFGLITSTLVFISEYAIFVIAARKRFRKPS